MIKERLQEVKTLKLLVPPLTLPATVGEGADLPPYQLQWTLQIAWAAQQS